MAWDGWMMIYWIYLDEWRQLYYKSYESLFNLELGTLLRKKVRKEKRRKEKQGLPADRAVPSVDWAEATQHWNYKRPTWDSDSLVQLSYWDGIFSGFHDFPTFISLDSNERVHPLCQFWRNARSIWALHVPWRPSLPSSSNYDVFFRHGKNCFPPAIFLSKINEHITLKWSFWVRFLAW